MIHFHICTIEKPGKKLCLHNSPGSHEAYFLRPLISGLTKGHNTLWVLNNVNQLALGRVHMLCPSQWTCGLSNSVDL